MTSPAVDPLILAIDEGTTNAKAIVVDGTGAVRSTASAPVARHSPRAGWVEQSAQELWSATVTALRSCLAHLDDRVGLGASRRIAAVAVSSQRETAVIWDRHTGTPLGPALSWQDTRTAPACQQLDAQVQARTAEITGQNVDPMFTAPKFRWLLDQDAGGNPALGTVDSWLIWNLTGEHWAEAGNASRTLLLDTTDLTWSDEMLSVFDIPASLLGEVTRSRSDFGRTRQVPGLPDGLPVVAVLADSHAALWAQSVSGPTTKITYGTGSSVMAPATGPGPGTTLAWWDGQPRYAREANVLSTGAALEWCSELLGLGSVADLVALAATVDDNDPVVLVPALTGLGAPYWDAQARASLTGMSSGTTRAHVARAAVAAVAHQVADAVESIDPDGTVVNVDGGMTTSALIMQDQADLLRRSVRVNGLAELSAWGAAHLGLTALGEQPPAPSVTSSYQPERDRAGSRQQWSARVAATRAVTQDTARR